MADRRSDDSPEAPYQQPPSQPQTPPQGQYPGQQAGQQPGQAGVGSEPPRDLTERINAAYASSAPVLPDETDDKGPKQSGSERFAAVLAKATQSRSSQSRSTQAKPAQVREPKDRPAATASTAPSKSGSAPRRVRKARLRLTHVDPWSVMKTAFLLAVALGIVTVVAVGVVWSVLGAAGVWTSIDSTVGDVLGENGQDFRVEDYLGMSRVMGFTMIVAVVDVVLVTVIATLGAFLYNLAAALLGGVEVVLAEEDR